MIDVIRDPNAQVFPAAKAGVTPTLSPSSGSEPAILATTPGLATIRCFAIKGRIAGRMPTQSPGAPKPASAPSSPAAPSADGIDLLVLSEPARNSSDFLCLIPWRQPVLPISSPRPVELASTPSDISLVETKEVAPVTPAVNKPLRQAIFDPYAVRREFPILNERVNGRRLVWLDNAATTQKPQPVIDRLSYFYAHENSNIHRAAHTLAAPPPTPTKTPARTCARFLGASSAKDIVFLRGATEAINLVAQAWGCQFVGAGDEIVITHLEHHANIVPWQQLCPEPAQAVVTRSTTAAR